MRKGNLNVKSSKNLLKPCFHHNQGLPLLRLSAVIISESQFSLNNSLIDMRCFSGQVQFVSDILVDIQDKEIHSGVFGSAKQHGTHLGIA